jgi:subtilisin family serine protease
MNSPTDRTPAGNPQHAADSLQVRVLDIRRNPVDGARVRLSGDGIDLELRWDDATSLYRAEAELHGSFVLSVSANGLEGQERQVKFPHRSPVEFVLGEPGLPFYHRGTVKTPFEPRPDLIAVTLDESPDAEPWVGLSTPALGLVQEPQHEQVRRNNVRVFRLPAHWSGSERQGLVNALREVEVVQLFGPVLEMFEERLVYLTHQFIVKFTAGVTPEQVEQIVNEHGFRVVRPVAASPDAFLIEGEPTLDYRLLAAANELAAKDGVEYVEPNAVMTSILFAVNPADFLVKKQWHLPLIGLPDAWQILRNENAAGVQPGMPGDRTYGDAEIQIAVFDSGLETRTTTGVTQAMHPEFQGNVTSGAAKVGAFYDAVNMVANNDTVEDEHGTACAGIAAALTDNLAPVKGETEGIAGAAGNCRVVAIRAPEGYPVLRWVDAFVWMAGFDPGWIVDGTTYKAGAVFPPLLVPGVDVATFSLRVPDTGVMDDSLDFLATYGRGGRGIVSFLAAGNTPAPISHRFNNTIADHEKVIAVAASIHTDGRAANSCYDLAIDLCAPSSGDDLQTILGVPQVMTTDTVHTGTLEGHTGGLLNYRHNFGGTSAATPLVAGVAALMLSIEPTLRWDQVYEILRDTAVKIDLANGMWTLDARSRPVHSQWYGYGRVDAAAAVADARDFNRVSSSIEFPAPAS